MEHIGVDGRFFAVDGARGGFRPSGNAQIQPEPDRTLHAHSQPDVFAKGIALCNIHADGHTFRNPLDGAGFIAERRQSVASRHPHRACRDSQRGGRAALARRKLVGLLNASANVQRILHDTLHHIAAFRRAERPLQRFKRANHFFCRGARNAACGVRPCKKRRSVIETMRRAMISHQLFPCGVESRLVFHAAFIQRAQTASAKRCRNRLPVNAPIRGILLREEFLDRAGLRERMQKARPVRPLRPQLMTQRQKRFVSRQVVKPQRRMNNVSGIGRFFSAQRRRFFH